MHGQCLQACKGAQISPAKLYNQSRLQCHWALYFLVPMLFELGLGKLSGRCARLASDEPES